MSEDAYIHKVLPGSPGGPLVFAFHGTGGDEEQLAPLARDLAPDATIVAPRGDVLEQGAARFFRRTGEGVYDMADLERATGKMAAFVKAHVDAAKPSAVFGLGYSNGANILASVLFAAPALFDAAALMHPLIPFQPEMKGDFTGKRILITAGRRDPICPPAITKRLESWLLDAGADVTMEWHEGGHEMRPGEIEAARKFFGHGGSPSMSGEHSEIRLEDSGSKGRYVLRSPGGEVAELTFTKVGERQIIIDHTEVPDAFRGQGVGLLLVSRAVDDARAAGRTIIPLCPFASAQFRRHPEWADVLRK